MSPFEASGLHRWCSRSPDVGQNRKVRVFFYSRAKKLVYPTTRAIDRLERMQQNRESRPGLLDGMRFRLKHDLSRGIGLDAARAGGIHRTNR